MTPFPVIVGYSLNLFSSESLADVRAALENTMSVVRDVVFPGEPMGVELRLGLRAIAELERDPGRVSDFGQYLEDAGFVPFTLNGFPLGDFQAPRVKERVFLPSWLEEARVEATKSLADLAVAWMGTLPESSVSTHTGAFRTSSNPDVVRIGVVRNLARVASHLARLEEETGKRVTLCVEPEPWSTFENLEETIELFDLLDRSGTEIVKADLGGGEDAARDVLRRYIRVTLDACHFSVQFDDPVESLDRLHARGIHVGKVHLSSALAVKNPGRNPEAMSFLAELAEPRFLHQAVGVDRRGRVVLRCKDLPELLARKQKDLERLREVRVHFHVPLFFEANRGVQSTRDETARLYRETRSRGTTSAYTIETYTWSILQGARWIGAENLASGIIEEYRWIRSIGGPDGGTET